MKKFLLSLIACLLLSATAYCQVTDDTFVNPERVLPPQGAVRLVLVETLQDTTLSIGMVRTATVQEYHVFDLTLLDQNDNDAQIVAYNVVGWDWNEDTATWQNRQGTFANPITCIQTLHGDANLDGVVNAPDLNAVALNWQQSGKTWQEGDFTGDGIVNAADLNKLGLYWLLSTETEQATVLYVPRSGDNIALEATTNGRIHFVSKEG